MQTRVTKDGSDYVLNGRKVFVTNAPIADLFVVYGTLDPKLGVTGICGFIIEKGTPGLSVGKKKDKMACAPHSWPRSYSRETLFFGNGGSAADAQRLAAEFVDDSFPNVQDCRRLR